MKNTLNTTFLFSDYPLKISEKNAMEKTRQALIVASITKGKLYVKRKDYRVDPIVNDPKSWDETWFSNYE